VTQAAIPDTASSQQILKAISLVLSGIGSLPPNPNLLLHLSGGVVFSSETLNDYFNSGGFPRLKRHIYALVFEAMSNSVLDAQHMELSLTRPTSSSQPSSSPLRPTGAASGGCGRAPLKT
jgi:hypothetical protein